MPETGGCEVKQGVETQVKFKKLKLKLQLPQWQVVGLLESIWKLAMSSAQAGDIGRYSDEDIAVCIEYAGDANELIEAMVESGWLDKDPEFRLVIHDWSEHAPTWLRGNFTKHKRQFADVVAKQRAKHTAKQPEPPPEQGATKSSQAKPSLILLVWTHRVRTFRRLNSFGD
jgi:hypothetical protein